ncbi:hypothetical protein ACFPC0_11015 [Streptomyces andamanensis]|uniref:Uncharacterized protein n=1 Tax=Streptomyces andamanensis TaxID=1565035 RepID=A0ABV8TCI5_9ACTN
MVAGGSYQLHPAYRVFSAAQVLELNRYSLLDPRQEIGRSRIRVVCALCQTEVYVSVARLRRDTAVRNGRPREVCGHTAVDGHPYFMPRPSRAEDLQTLKANQYEPVDEWPRSSTAEWHVRCLLCDAEVWVRVQTIKSRSSRSSCRHPLNKTLKPSPERDVEALARKLLTKNSYESIGPWPGHPTNPWHVRCLLCEAEVWVTTNSMTRAGRKQCNHPTRRIIKPSALARRRAAEYRDRSE